MFSGRGELVQLPAHSACVMVRHVLSIGVAVGQTSGRMRVVGGRGMWDRGRRDNLRVDRVALQAYLRALLYLPAALLGRR